MHRSSIRVRLIYAGLSTAAVVLLLAACDFGVSPETDEEDDRPVWVSDIQATGNLEEITVRIQTPGPISNNAIFGLNGGYDDFFGEEIPATDFGVDIDVFLISDQLGASDRYMLISSRTVEFSDPGAAEHVFTFQDGWDRVFGPLPADTYKLGATIQAITTILATPWYFSDEVFTFVPPEDTWEEDDDRASANTLDSVSYDTELLVGTDDDENLILADPDVFELEITEAPGTLNLNIQVPLGFSRQESYTLCDGTGTMLHEATDTLEFDIETAGTYYVELSPDDPYAPYRLELKYEELVVVVVPTDDEFEDNNDTPFNAPTFGDMILNTNAGYGPYVSLDDDYWSFDIPASGKQLTVRAKFTHAEGDIDLLLLDSSYEIIGSSFSTTDNEEIYIADAAVGRYYVWVAGNFDGNSYFVEVQYED